MTAAWDHSFLPGLCAAATYLIGKKLLNLMVFGVRTIAPEENRPPVRVRFLVRIRVRFRQFSSRAIVQEPCFSVKYSCRIKVSSPWKKLLF